MPKIAEILDSVQTQIQFAALAILLLYGIARALIATGRWKPADQIVRLFLNWSFSIGLIALLFSYAGPILLQFMMGGDVIKGSVYSSDNTPIVNATVSGPGIGSQSTDATGVFRIDVPSNRVRPDYTITAKANGFNTTTKTIPRNQISSIDFQLLAQPVPHAIQQIMSDFLVGQYYGLPFVVVSLNTKSPNNSQIYIDNINAIIGKDFESIKLTPYLITTISERGPYIPITGPIPIGPTQTKIWILLIVEGNIVKLMSDISNLPDYKGKPQPCFLLGPGDFVPVTDSAFSLIQTFSRQNFIWTSGTWNFHVKFSVAGQDDALDKKFDLTQTDINNLQKSIALVRMCQSVNSSAPIAQIGIMSNYISK